MGRIAVTGITGACAMNRCAGRGAYSGWRIASHGESELMATTASQEQGSTLLTSYDLYLFNEGSHVRLYDKMGAHPGVVDGMHGTHFAVWAPNAERVSLKGDFNGWNVASHPLQPRSLVRYLGNVSSAYRTGRVVQIPRCIPLQQLRRR